MKKDQIKKNLGSWVRLVPPAIQLDQHGRQVGVVDDDWYVQSMAAEGPVITNTKTGHVTTLGEDNIHSYTSHADRSQNGARYGFFDLNVQLFIQGDKVDLRPIRQSGGTLPVKSQEVSKKVVNFQYLETSGMQSRLKAEGYELYWARPDNVAEMIDVKGWEEVIERDTQGQRTSFRLWDGGVLLKRRT